MGRLLAHTRCALRVRQSGLCPRLCPVRARVVYDEAQINSSGNLPTSVFLVGKIDHVYRIGLVVRQPRKDDDHD